MVKLYFLWYFVWYFCLFQRDLDVDRHLLYVALQKVEKPPRTKKGETWWWPRKKTGRNMLSYTNWY